MFIDIKDTRKTTFDVYMEMFPIGELSFKRYERCWKRPIAGCPNLFGRFVYSKDTKDVGKGFEFLLDEALKMDTAGKMSMNLVEAMIGVAAKMSFRKSAEGINQNTNANVTFQSIWNVLQKLGGKIK
ncbi:hypothetical protein LQZ18_13000 [Lachnospiraceae bacterium ZAX-1]